MSIDSNAIFLLTASPFVGSFLAAAAVRLPQNQNPIRGRSKCPRCGHTLGARDLVPVLSWIAQQGRCRYCATRIDPIYPIVETAAVCVAAWAMFRTDGWIAWATCALGWALLVLGTIDLRHRILPNVLTLPLLVAGLAVAFVLEPALAGPHLLGAGIGFGALYLIGWSYSRLRAREGIGMGDMKLLAAAGAWTGWVGLPAVVLWACISAFAEVLVTALRGRSPSLHTPIAFGTHLCIGLWLVWLYGPLELSVGA